MEEARQAHGQNVEMRLERQGADGEETRVMVLSPTVALVANTVEENRAYFTDGSVWRSRVASLVVYVKESGEWKHHSSQDAIWPLADGDDNPN